MTILFEIEYRAGHLRSVAPRDWLVPRHWRQHLGNDQPAELDHFRCRSDMLPRAVPLAAPPFADPNILRRERRAGTSLRELHPRCLDVSLWRNRDASCRSGKDSLRSLLRRRRLEAQKTKPQPRKIDDLIAIGNRTATYRAVVASLQAQQFGCCKFFAHRPCCKVPIVTSDRKARLCFGKLSSPAV